MFPSNKEIAMTIINQMGGPKFVAMTGSKNFIYNHNSVTMELTRNKGRAKFLNIELTVMDTYKMTFSRFDSKTFDRVILKEYENVYNDGLAEIFESFTGLRTRL